MLCTTCEKRESKFKVCCSRKKKLQHLCTKCFINEYADGDYVEDKEEFNDASLINDDETLDNAYAVANSFYYSEEDWEESHKKVYIYFPNQDLYVKKDLSLTPDKKEAYLFKRNNINNKTFELDDLKLKDFPEVILNNHFTKYDLPNKKEILQFVLHYFDNANVLKIFVNSYSDHNLFVQILDNKLILLPEIEYEKEPYVELLNDEEMGLPTEYFIYYNSYISFKTDNKILKWPLAFEEKLILELKKHLKLKKSEVDLDFNGFLIGDEKIIETDNEHYFEDIDINKEGQRDLFSGLYLDKDEKIRNKKLKSFKFEYENENYSVKINIFSITNKESDEEIKFNESV